MNILIVGCSYSADCGFVDPAGKVWYHHIPKSHSITNLSLRGQSNYKIFVKSCQELLDKNNYDLVIVQWTTLHRLNFNDGLSVYDNPVNLTLSTPKDSSLEKFHSIWTNNFINSRIELSEFLSLASTLACLLNSQNVPYMYVKMFDNFLTDLQVNDWRQASELFLESVLHSQELPDWEIDAFYNALCRQFAIMKNLSEANWLNLSSSDWYSSIVDFADDNLHPGVKTNEIFYNQIYNFIKTLGIYL